MSRKTPYVEAKRKGGKPQRLVVLLPKSDLIRIDEWGVATGKPCRSDAVRELLSAGLEVRARIADG